MITTEGRLTGTEHFGLKTLQTHKFGTEVFGH